MAQQATRVLSIVATGTITKGRAVAWNGTQAGAASPIIGIADHNAVAGDAVRVIAGATAEAEAGAVIDGVETRLATDAQGRLVPWTAGVVAARLLPNPGNTASAAGIFVEVVPIQN